MNVRVFETADETARALAERMASTIRAKPDVVLGLPTGKSPITTYAELRRMHDAGAVDFSQVRTFNVDEFAGVDRDHPGSFRRFMDEHLFHHVNVPAANIHFLNGTAGDLDAECVRYEAAIAEAGGIDLQLLGIGANGHIGFNEPGDELIAPTHRVSLHDVTRRDNAALFGGETGSVPREAISMGLGTILKASAIVMIATGDRKATCVQRMMRGPLTTRLPASFLQTHRHVEVFLDRAAAMLLT
jgi:glucosamine-6-phosphate deaminase